MWLVFEARTDDSLFFFCEAVYCLYSVVLLTCFLVNQSQDTEGDQGIKAVCDIASYRQISRILISRKIVNLDIWTSDGDRIYDDVSLLKSNPQIKII